MTVMTAWKSNNRILACLITLWVAPATLMDARAQQRSPLTNAVSMPQFNLQSERKGIWENGIGEGSRSGVQSVGVSVGANYGLAVLGSREAHHLALISLSYGLVLAPVQGEGHWYRGNWELRGELFGGAEFSPDTEWFVGLTPHLRYSFATGTRWIPFADAGAGVTATGIGEPDLSGTFEFNLQAGVGMHWFIKDNLALTVEAKYVHWSCAGLSDPNLGLNGVTGLAGVTFLF